VLGISPSVWALGQFSRATEAGTILDRAVAKPESNEAAPFATFNMGKAGFRDRDLDVFCHRITTGKITIM